MKNIKWKHYINYIVVAIATIVLGALGLIGALPSSTLYMLEKIGIAVILAVSLNIVVGLLGELSLGHAGFMCVGAYLGGKIASLLDKGGDNIGVLLLSVLIGGAVAAIFGFIIGLPALRLRGDYLAIVTLAFGEIVRTIFMNSSSDSFGGTLGLPTPRYDKNYLFIVAFLLVLVTLAVTQNMMRSKHGRAITSIRDSEIAARATGINVTKYKLIAFTVSAFFAGVAGALYSASNFRVTSSVFDYNYSIEILVMVVLGGMGSINGSIISAALITFLNLQLSTVLTGDLAVLKNLIYAVILIIVVIYNNAPALKFFREKYNLKNLIDLIFKKKEENSATQHDDAARWDVVPTKIEMNEVLSVDLQVKESVADPDKGVDD